MKQLLLLWSLVGGLCLSVSAQTIDRIDQVYLQGGNLLQGAVVDTLDGRLRLRVVGDSLIEVPLVLVQEVKQGSQGLLHTVKGRTVHASGTYFSLQGSTLTAKSQFEWTDELRWALGLHFSMGHYVFPWLSVGGGIGVDAYEQELIVPVFAEARVYAPNLATAPYFSLQAGYGMTPLRMFDREEFDKSHGGLMWYPSIGVRLASRRNTDIHLDAGYKFQKVTYHYDYPDDWWTTEEIERHVFKSFAVRLGFVF